MPSRAEIVSFDDSPPPPGADPWVPGAAPANAGGEHVMQYNARKQQVLREIYQRAFAAAGLLDD